MGGHFLNCIQVIKGIKFLRLQVTLNGHQVTFVRRQGGPSYVTHL